MGMINERGWTPLNEDDDIWTEDHYDKIKPFADALAHEWSRIHHESEQRGFQRQAAYEDGYQDYEYGDDDEDAEVFNYADSQRRLRDELERVQMEHIEKELYKLDVRMMRPYEHWNEDEHLISYMENRGY